MGGVEYHCIFYGYSVEYLVNYFFLRGCIRITKLKGYFLFFLTESKGYWITTFKDFIKVIV